MEWALAVKPGVPSLLAAASAALLPIIRDRYGRWYRGVLALAVSLLLDPLEFRGVYYEFVKILDVPALHVYFRFGPHVRVNSRESLFASESPARRMSVIMLSAKE